MNPKSPPHGDVERAFYLEMNANPVSGDDLITYCGLYCGLCAERCFVPYRAGELLALVRDEGYDYFYAFVPGIKDHYLSFIKVLENFSTMDCSCRNRKGGPPNCAIHACAKGKGVFVCMDCMDFPCEKWNAISRIHPLLERDAERYREVGKEKWLNEQKDRAKKGFYYGMVKQNSALGQDEKKDKSSLL